MLSIELDFDRITVDRDKILFNVTTLFIPSFRSCRLDQ